MRKGRAVLAATVAVFSVCMASCHTAPEPERKEEPAAPAVIRTEARAPAAAAQLTSLAAMVYAAEPSCTPTPEPTTDETPEPLPNETTEPPPRDWTEEAAYLAKTVYGEARFCSKTEQAAVMWCILNRVDDQSGMFPDDIPAVVTQRLQFHGYAADNPVLPELLELALDVIDRWQREKSGETDVGRVLPPEWLYFHGDLIAHNYFQKEYRGAELWNWSLPSPYES